MNFKFITWLRILFFILLFIAIAGPRWQYQEISIKQKTKKSDQAKMQNIEKIHKFPIWMENALTLRTEGL